MYRLHIDIPLNGDEEDSIAAVKRVIAAFSAANTQYNLGMEKMNYRLGHDEDRQKSNYMVKNENGHISNKKSRLTFEEEITQ